MPQQAAQSIIIASPTTQSIYHNNATLGNFGGFGVWKIFYFVLNLGRNKEIIAGTPLFSGNPSFQNFWICHWRLSRFLIVRQVKEFSRLHSTKFLFRLFSGGLNSILTFKSMHDMSRENRAAARFFEWGVQIDHW